MTDRIIRKRVLLVTSAYAPTTSADMQRARLLAWDLPALGWDVEVLHPGPEFQRPEYFEPDSAPFFNPETVCHEVSPRDSWWMRRLNMRSISWRALRPMRDAGDELLRSRAFDVIYISTASFNLFSLGRRWARKFGVPYVLDYHDPWVRDRLNFTTTKGRLKLRIAATLARWMEPYALRGAAGVVSVSPAYLADLRRRYGDVEALRPDRCAVIPFAATERDFVVARGRGEAGRRPWKEIIYVGAGGSIMAKSFASICASLAALRNTSPELLASIRIKLYGTYAYWRAGDPTPLQDVAARFGLADVVEEMPARISYRRATQLARESDGLLILGVDEPGYVPSKLFQYALAGRPLLACFRSDSPAVKYFSGLPGLGNLMTFDDKPHTVDTREMRCFLAEVQAGAEFDRSSLIAEYLAPAAARKHAALFETLTHDPVRPPER